MKWAINGLLPQPCSGVINKLYLLPRLFSVLINVFAQAGLAHCFPVAIFICITIQCRPGNAFVIAAKKLNYFQKNSPKKFFFQRLQSQTATGLHLNFYRFLYPQLCVILD